VGHLAIDRGCPAQEIVAKALDEYLKKEGEDGKDRKG
jgi:hypothetical protein